MSEIATKETKGFYKLSWAQRIGFGSGDLAQNLIYQTVCTYLLIFYTSVFGIPSAQAAVMFLIVRLVDVLWDPFVGAWVDSHSPKLGKYRSYLILGGIPLTGFAILCFWNTEFTHGSLMFAYITYVCLSLCYTLVNVPYGALNASLTRDNDEITTLTSTRMFMANIGGLIVQAGIPLIVKKMSPDGSMASAASADAWFTTMTIFALAGLALLIFCFTQTKERVVMESSQTDKVKWSDLFTEFVRNKPLRILALFFITAFAMMSVSNAAGPYYMEYNLAGAPDVFGIPATSIFQGLGTIPAFIFLPLVPMIKRKIGKKGMFFVFLSIAIVGMAILFTVSSISALRNHMWLVYLAQFIKASGVITATGYMWALVPEVISYGEYTSGRRISGIVNALTGIFFKAGMALGGVIPGFVLAAVKFDIDPNSIQAQQGILWILCIIPAIMLGLAMFIISKYNLDDESLDKMNREIEARS
ncbi:MAG: MFS transporter [Bacteroidales bacterium]|nr:MFS transporter [Bacteroidales bacterium]